jgi:hypothetical protein
MAQIRSYQRDATLVKQAEPLRATARQQLLIGHLIHL